MYGRGGERSSKLPPSHNPLCLLHPRPEPYYGPRHLKMHGAGIDEISIRICIPLAGSP
jgi:hypothetical protein